MMNSFQQSIKESILNADSLTIRQGRFAPNERGEFVRLSEDERISIEEVNKLMNWKGSYRVYFSIPYRLVVIPRGNFTPTTPGGSQPRASSQASSGSSPSGSSSQFLEYLNKFTPLWTRKIEDFWLDSKFRQLDKKYEDIWSHPPPRIEGESDDAYSEKCKTISIVKKKTYASQSDEPIKIEEGDKEAGVVSELRPFFSKMLSYLEVLDLKERPRDLKYALYGNPSNTHDMKLDSAFFDAENNIYFFIEFKRYGLKRYVDENGSIKQSPKMITIMKQVVKYMLGTRTDICLISDAEVWILVQLDFDAEGFKVGGPRANRLFGVEVPFKYRVFYLSDANYPLQAIICSVAYDQKLRFGDPYQEENVNKLEALLIRKNKRPASAEDYSSGSSPSSRQSSTHSRSSARSRKRSRYDTLATSIQEETESDTSQAVNALTRDSRSTRNPTPRYRDNGMDMLLKKGEFQLLQSGENYLTTVLIINRVAIDRNLSHLNIPQSVEHVIVKVYDLFNSHIFFEKLKIDNHPTNERVERFYMDKFDTEVECYDRISEFNALNESDPIRVPKIYDHGRGIVREGQHIITHGGYLILEYIHRDEYEIYDEIEMEHQLDLIEALGIEHNDFYPKNIIVSGGKFHLIDFSEAILKDRDEELSDTADKETPTNAHSEDSNEESES